MNADLIGCERRQCCLSNQMIIIIAAPAIPWFCPEADRKITASEIESITISHVQIIIHSVQAKRLAVAHPVSLDTKEG